MYLVRQGGKPLLTVRLGGLRGWLGGWLEARRQAGWSRARGRGVGVGAGGAIYLPTYLYLPLSTYLSI